MIDDVHVYLGLGSNMGDRVALLQRAVHSLQEEKEIHIIELSSIYETDPIGFTEQPSFYNLVVHLVTTLSPSDLLQKILSIETKLNRVRKQRWGPRTIDIDILLYGDQRVEEENLTIPHPRLHEREVVLIPLLEIAGDFRIPHIDEKVSNLLQKLPEQGVRQMGTMEWVSKIER